MGAVARADAPTCRPDELVSEVAARVPEEWGVCVVVNEVGVVAGLLGRSALATAAAATAEDAMTLGPSTIRPSARREAIASRMHDEGLTRIVVTTSDGVLVGVLRREDLI